MVKKADAGDIVDQEAFPIGIDDTPTDVYTRLLPAAERVLERSAVSVIEGTAPRIRQLESKATTFGRRRPEDGLIDWRCSAEDVRNLVRAVTKPYPGAFTFAGEKRVTVWWSQHVAKSSAADGSAHGRPSELASGGMVASELAPGGMVASELAPGRVIRRADGLFVACGDRRLLRLAKVEIDGVEGDGISFGGVLMSGAELSSKPSGYTRWTS